MLKTKMSRKDEARCKELYPISHRYSKFKQRSDTWRKNTGQEMYQPGALEEQKNLSEAASREIQEILAKYR